MTRRRQSVTDAEIRTPACRPIDLRPRPAPGRNGLPAAAEAGRHALPGQVETMGRSQVPPARIRSYSAHSSPAGDRASGAEQTSHSSLTMTWFATLLSQLGSSRPGTDQRGPMRSVSVMLTASASSGAVRGSIKGMVGVRSFWLPRSGTHLGMNTPTGGGKRRGPLLGRRSRDASGEGAPLRRVAVLPRNLRRSEAGRVWAGTALTSAGTAASSGTSRLPDRQTARAAYSAPNPDRD